VKKQTFDLNKTLEQINLYAETAYSKLPIPKQSKVFYHINEWSGWRFYLKAIRNKDWESIKYHIWKRK
jgi:hypothetical protein